MDSKILEREAYTFLSQEKFEEAFRLFKKAAQGYRHEGNHRESALCYASAASCWSKKSGEHIFYNAATCYEKAAIEAQKGLDYEYASLLFKYAAITHERDGEFLDFSKCFYRSKESMRRFLNLALFRPSKIPENSGVSAAGKEKGFFKKLYSWFILTFSYIIWGHGERPHKTFFSGLLIILLFSFFYMSCHLSDSQKVFSPDFFDSLYFSVVTFTTVGYGDFVPVGIAKIGSTLESLAGLFIIPLFVISLSRKYLRA
ncbi:MAG: hypothetical protein JW867_04010 [Candidatus Omnitrophica bacterium]|nr:hypothetical protein [Candidatus Omnitrophota bacterium]